MNYVHRKWYVGHRVLALLIGIFASISSSHGMMALLRMQRGISIQNMRQLSTGEQPAWQILLSETAQNALAQIQKKGGMPDAWEFAHVIHRNPESMSFQQDTVILASKDRIEEGSGYEILRLADKYGMQLRTEQYKPGLGDIYFSGESPVAMEDCAALVDRRKWETVSTNAIHKLLARQFGIGPYNAFMQPSGHFLHIADDRDGSRLRNSNIGIAAFLCQRTPHIMHKGAAELLPCYPSSIIVDPQITLEQFVDRVYWRHIVETEKLLEFVVALRQDTYPDSFLFGELEKAKFALCSEQSFSAKTRQDLLAQIKKNPELTITWGDLVIKRPSGIIGFAQEAQDKLPKNLDQ